ncbi:DUF4280 domain-containing protein [Flavobacterium lindanitolerans]|jgi:hypothetical protein|uniref:Uncharacterized protein DUF4280 n=1 Tax=Flavobacterium lindanitolerans TaxID=428988 RepID=A0A497UZ97_9FLAO|nr:DUF4280 domain-containing protein [Flavobacterium lindanitolerans]MDQ7961342.1 DUF4280 domain-containing protein [Flavobacterium lindanitolerans]PKW29272.1 uncharacterized protein DUF4280 [Flavobacterium lindanitolerans]RLJ35227.1 uncharacterized protein DUF4280 [Flavobacterium lindanitolerans]
MEDVKENNKKEIAEKREEREKEDKVSEDLKLVIDMAKIQCTLCTNPQGILKVNFDTPTTQDKLTATVVEKDMRSLIFMGTCIKSPNSAAPCASVMQLGDWKDVGTLKVQDQFPLLKKSTIPCNYGGSTIEITDSGQRSAPAEVAAVAAPVPQEEEVLVNGHFYNTDGTFEGKADKKEYKGSVNDVYVCSGKETKNDSKGKPVEVFKNAELLKENGTNITHSDFCYVAYIVSHEAGEEDLKELKCIAYASFNRAKNTKTTWKKLLSTGYSSVPNKTELSQTKKDNKSKLTRQALFYVLQGKDDLTKGAEFWDGTDFLAWGNSETNPYNKLGQNKFDEYKFVEIPKDVYDEFLKANGTSARYKDKENHDAKTDKGTHEHTKKKVKKPVIGKDGKQEKGKDGKPLFQEVEVADRIKYAIPASDFTDTNNWTSGNFYYDTGVKTTNGISGTIAAGKSVFWKLTPTRLTNATEVKK